MLFRSHWAAKAIAAYAEAGIVRAKAGADVKEGDEIFIQFGNSSMKVRFIKLLETCKKEEAFDMYEII